MMILMSHIACWVRDTAPTENEKDTAYKKALLGGLMKSTTTMNTQIKGQKFYKETFHEKHEEEIKKAKEFFRLQRIKHGSNERNPRNNQNDLFKTLTRMFSGPITQTNPIRTTTTTTPLRHIRKAF